MRWGCEVAADDSPVIDLQRIDTRFGSHVVHDGLDLQLHRGEILGLAGGSGAGKSVLLREMILLQRPTSGTVRIFGADAAHLDGAQRLAICRRWGVMFQRGGLFSSLSVRRNVGLPLHEHTTLGSAEINQIAERQLALTGLPADAGLKLPGELSGGMLKRAALARAIALDPEMLFLDEPTSGLDPASAAEVDELILATQARVGSSVLIVSHDVGLLWRVCTRVAVLGEGRVLAQGTMDALSHESHSAVAAYFAPQRHRA